ATFFFYVCAAATTVYCPLSLHDALPISHRRAPLQPGVELVVRQFAQTGLRHRVGHLAAQAGQRCGRGRRLPGNAGPPLGEALARDRKSTRLNSSHVKSSYAVFCLKKKKE